MNRLTSMVSSSGERYDLNGDQVNDFRKADAGAKTVRTFKVGDDVYDINEDQVSDFMKAAPNADEIHSYNLPVSGRVEVPQSQFGEFLKEYRKPGGRYSEDRIATMNKAIETAQNTEVEAPYNPIEMGLKGGVEAVGKITGTALSPVTGVMRLIGTLGGARATKFGNAMIDSANAVDSAFDWHLNEDGDPGVDAGRKWSQTAFGLMPWMVGGAAKGGLKLAAMALLSANAGNDAAIQTYDQAKEKGLDDDEAIALSLGSGIANFAGAVALGMAPMAKWLKGVGLEAPQGLMKFGQAAARGTPKGFNGLVNTAYRGYLRGVVTQQTIGIAESSGIMAAQGFVNDLISQGAEEKGWDGDLDWGRAFKAAGMSGAEGAVIGLGMGAVHAFDPSVRKTIRENFKRELVEMTKTREGREQLKEMNPDGFEALYKAGMEDRAPTRKEAEAAWLPEMSAEERKELADNLVADERLRKQKDDAERASVPENKERLRKERAHRQNAEDKARKEEERKRQEQKRLEDEEERAAVEEEERGKRFAEQKAREEASEQASYEEKMASLEESKAIAHEKAMDAAKAKEEAKKPRISVKDTNGRVSEDESPFDPYAKKPQTERQRERIAEWPEYEEFLRKNRLEDNDKSFGRFVDEGELDPDLKKVWLEDKAKGEAQLEAKKKWKDAKKKRDAELSEKVAAQKEERERYEAALAEYERNEAERKRAMKQGKTPPKAIEKPVEPKADAEPSKPTESFRSTENRIKPRGAKFRHHGEETKAPEKAPDGKGKMVEATGTEKPVAETPEQFRERVKDDPVLKRIDAEMKKAKTAAEKNALTEQFKQRVAELKTDGDETQSVPTEPVSPKKAEKTQPTKKRKGERFRIVDEVNEALRRHEPGEKSGEVFDDMFAKWKKLQQRIRVREDNLTGDFRDPSEMKKERELSKLRKEAEQLKREMENAGVDTGKTVQFKIGENGTYTVKDNPFALRVFRDKMSKSHLSVEDAKRIEKLRSNEDVISWAKKNGREIIEGKATTGTVNDYLKDQVKKANEATKRLFRDAEVEVKDREWDPELDGDGKTLRSKDGIVVGTFDPETKKVTLYRGADAKTVFHELVGHGVEDWAARNNEKLHGKLMDLSKEAPKEMLADIRRKYPDADEATIAKEIIARFAEGKGLENIKLKDAPKNWFAKAYTTVRDAILGFIEKMGGNRIDLEKIEEMTPIEAMDYITKQIGKGKTLGEIGGKYTGKMGLGEKWANAFYDRFTSVYKVSKEAGDAKTIQKGKEAEFQVKKFDPKKKAYGDILKKNDVASETVSEYLKAEGAIDRYERLKREAEAEGKEFDPRKAGGIDIEEARRTLAEFDKLPAERLAKIKEAVKFMRDLQHEGLMERVRAGLISAEEARAFEEAEPNHVPLRSAIDEHGEYVGGASGRGMNSPEFKKAEGRFTESGDPVAWMFEEYADAHTRAIENDTRVALARAVAADPSIGSIETNPELKEQRVKGGEGLPNAVKFKEVKDGKSMTRTILLNGERGSAIASAYTNRNLKRMPAPVHAFMRLWSSTATEWSPTFAFRNAIADNVDVASVVLAEKGVKEGGAWIKDFWKNKNPLRKEIWSFVRDGKIADGSTLDQYVKEGGMIGGFQREGYEGAKSAFSAETIAKEIKKGKSATNAVLTFIPKYVKAFNSYVELMTRVAAFKTNLDRGMSPKEAAIWSRRISVDFNRKGNVTPVTNTLFMFSNSTIGATMRQLEAMKVGFKTPNGRRAMASIAGLGVIEALAEHFLNLDDDDREAKGLSTRKDIIEHHRQTMLGVSKGDTVYGLKVHDDPLMMARFYANLATRYFLNKVGANNGVNEKHVYEEVRDGIIENIPKFFGMGGKTMEAGWSTWMPTALQPIVQDIDNKDFKGQDIRRKKFNESLPWSYNGRKSTPDFYKAISESINNMTGGSDSRKGSVDMAPETLKHYLTSTTKNMGTDLVNTVNLVANFITGDFGNIDSRSVPFARDLHRKTETSDNRYFELVRKYDADKYEFDHKRREWSMDERKSYSERHPWIRKGADGRTRIQKLKTQIDELRRREGGEAKGSSGTWHKVEMTDERKEQLKARRLELQGKVIKLMESMDR